jgi:hypothetical protein
MRSARAAERPEEWPPFETFSLAPLPNMKPFDVPADGRPYTIPKVVEPMTAGLG